MGAPPPPVPAMQCAKCGATIVPGTAFCAGCGAAVISASSLPASLTSAAPLSGPDTAAGPAPAVAVPPAGYVAGAPERQKPAIWIPMALVAVPVAAFFVALYAERGAPPARAFGHWIGLMLLPTLIAFISVKFRPSLKMRTFTTVFSLAGLFCVLAGVSGQMSRHAKTPQQIVKEALGKEPVDNSGTPSEREIARISREFFADMLAARKKHDAEAEALTPVLSRLYSAPSFANKQSMSDAAAAVGQIMEVDGVMMDKLQNLPQDLKARVDASSLGQRDKEDFMRGVQLGYGNSELIALYREVRTRERAWATSTIDLYSFASMHASGIKISGGTIVITDRKLLGDFNIKIKNSRALHRQLQDTNSRLLAAQAANMKKFGLTKSDLGLDKK
jgi:hypothetical protein